MKIGYARVSTTAQNLDMQIEALNKAERKVMDYIQAYLYAHSHPVNQWFYGHFHQSWHDEIDGIKYNMLDCLELRELR
ncbi:MAG: hypothetical protein II886_07555 [Prevotella sp.]|nr:hypothetical protein [Prevotella sp.]